MAAAIARVRARMSLGAMSAVDKDLPVVASSRSPSGTGTFKLGWPRASPYSPKTCHRSSLGRA